MGNVRVNRMLDFVERVGWTAIQAAAGALLDVLTTGELTWRAVGYAVAIAALKVIVAQRFGDTPTGDAIPGRVIDG
ncbi:MAG TPA: hypothetical protein VM344_06775 [Vitreimonas sp.]|nr:hypothetical protein [Vitreimonas sp.]